MLATFAALALAAAAPGQAVPYDKLEKATFSWGRQYDVVSQKTGRAYRIYVYVPSGPAPKEGWPVLYGLDGYISFPVLATRMMQRNDFDGKGIVVAIGYPDEERWDVRRFLDMTVTQPTDPYTMLTGDDKHPPENFADGENFYKFLVDELRPDINARFGGNPAQQSYMGYSLGGLYGLQILFEHPNAFQSYVIGSPAIWWNNREVLSLEAGFVREVRAGRTAPRILITADGWEQGDDSPMIPSSGEGLAIATKGLRVARMVDNARELADRLAAVKGKSPYQVKYVLFPETTHSDGAPMSTVRGLDFVFRGR